MDLSLKLNNDQTVEELEYVFSSDTKNLRTGSKRSSQQQLRKRHKTKEHIAHSGAWGIALIVIVVVSWFLYRYLAPKTWREWAGTGVIQAFIIALFPAGAKREERKVLEQFDDEYRVYRKRVPMFLPRWGQWGKLTTTRSDTSAGSDETRF